MNGVCVAIAAKGSDEIQLQSKKKLPVTRRSDWHVKSALDQSSDTRSMWGDPARGMARDFEGARRSVGWG